MSNEERDKLFMEYLRTRDSALLRRVVEDVLEKQEAEGEERKESTQ